MREAGTVFLAFSTVYDDTGTLDGSAYLEYGLRPKLTLGAKLDVDMTKGRMGDGTAFVFLRRPIDRWDTAYQLAYELGFGTTFGDGADPLLRSGLSYGRGFTLWDRNGWLAVDAAIEWALDNGPNTAKLDTTLGLTLNDRFQVMMQVFVTNSSAFSNTTLAPSVIWQPNAKTPSYQLGVEVDDDTWAVKLGLWRSF